MTRKEEKDELEGVETISRAQAEKEMQEAVKNVKKEGSHRTSRAKKQEEEEEEEVTPETRAQAEKELRAALQRIRNEKKK